MKVLKIICKFFIPLTLTLVIFSCTSLKLEQRVKVNADEDWLFAGGNPAKTNISKSNAVLEPPFKLHWEADVDGGLSTNCLAASDGILFINTLNGEFFTVDIRSGKGLGRVSAIGKASYSAPVIHNSNVILTSSGKNDNTIMSYNMIKGEYNWERDINWIETSPVLIQPENENPSLLVTSKNGKVYKLNTIDGNIIWEFLPDNRKNLNQFLTSPSEFHGKVFAGNTDGNLYALDLKTGSLLWKFNSGASIMSDASIYEDKIFFNSDNKYFYCLDLEGNLLWKYNTGTASVSSSTFYNDLVITSGVDGSVIAINRNNGTEVWRTYTKGTITASPILQNDKIFIGSYDKNFYCIDANNGSILWNFKCEGRIKTTAIVWKEFIFTASDDKYIYCFTK